MEVARGQRAVRLIVVDDEPLWLDLLRVALTSADVHVAAAYTDPQEALDQWSPGIDVALIDVELGRDTMNGFELARRLRARTSPLGVVFLTSVADPWMVDDAASTALAGTSYLLKRGVSDLAELQRAVQVASTGGIVMDPDIHDAIRGNGPLPGLTPLQGRMLRLMAAGRSNAQISMELGVALKTVESNITRISRTLGVGDSENVRVGCVTRYLAAASHGPHRSLGH
jgi:DNA-binding NarL/FixJ family response regulator